MPAAAIGAGIGAGGGLASGIGGKKAQNKANQLASKQLGLEEHQYDLGNAALGGAADYWRNLYKGGQAAVQATGPYASLIGQQGEGTRNAILAGTPRGGEQNLALAQNTMQTGNNIARLYAGMQPLAAQNLSQIGSAYLGSGGQLGFPAAMTGLGAAQMGLSSAQQGAGGFGSLLYNSLNKLQNRGGPTAASTFTTLGSGGGYGPPPTGVPGGIGS